MAVCMQDKEDATSGGGLSLFWSFFPPPFLPPDKLPGISRHLVVNFGTVIPLLGEGLIVLLGAGIGPFELGQIHKYHGFTTKMFNESTNQ